MKRLSAWLIGPLMITTLVVTAAPAFAAPARPKVVQGIYTAYGTFNGKDRQVFSLTLYKDHTGTDHFNDNIVWSLSGKDLTMVFDTDLWTYHGTKRKSGFNTASAPGSLTNKNGGSGTWYAVKND
jgi:hypothetical protein